MALGTDKIQVAVFHKDTGKIKQVVTVSREHAHLQHDGLDDHDWVEITGQDALPHPHTHAINPATMRLIPRPPDLEEEKEKKRLELEQRCRADINAGLMDGSVKDWSAHRAQCLEKLERLQGLVDSASDVAGIAAIVWG